MARAEIDDTYAEAFRSLYAEVLITARDRRWLDEAIRACTGNASSTILCDCEAGLDRYVGPGGDESFVTPDGRPGAIVQFHVPRFRKDRVEALERAVLVRVTQNIMTCPTCSSFNVLTESPTFYKMGRKAAFFGDGHQFRDVRHGRNVWVVPILAGEFIIERRVGYADGLMGGTSGSWAQHRMQLWKQRTEEPKRRVRSAGSLSPFLGEWPQADRRQAAGIRLRLRAHSPSSALLCGRS